MGAGQHREGLAVAAGLLGNVAQQVDGHADHLPAVLIIVHHQHPQSGHSRATSLGRVRRTSPWSLSPWSPDANLTTKPTSRAKPQCRSPEM